MESPTVLILQAIAYSIIAIFGLYSFASSIKSGKKVDPVEAIKLVYEMIPWFVEEAEHMLGTEINIVKRSYVISKVMGALPSGLEKYITEATIDNWIDAALEELKQIWNSEETKAESE